MAEVLIAMPTLDGQLPVQVVMSLMSVMARFGETVRPYWSVGDSNIRHCRNQIAHHFKKSECNQLVCIDSDIIFSIEDFAYLLDDPDGEPCEAVVAPYARKIVGRAPVDFGMGFCRLDRSVFEKLDAWTNEEGAEMLHRYFLDGELATDYYFDGATSDSRWFSEDTGFWHWCNLAGIKARREPRTKLGHIGRFVYGYPDQTPGLIPAEAGAQ